MGTERPDNRQDQERARSSVEVPLQPEILRQFGDDTEEEMLQEAHAHMNTPDGMTAAMDKRFGHELAAQLTDTQMQYAPMLQEFTVPAGGAMNERIETIAAGLLQPIEGADTHRYVRYEEGGGKTPWCAVNQAQIQRDRQLLKKLMDAEPQRYGRLKVLDTALQDFARKDPRYAVYQWEMKRAQNPVDKKVWKMLKLPIVLTATVAAIGTGILAIKNRGKGISVPLLYAGIAGLIAKPSLRNFIFQSSDEKTLEQIDIALNAPAMKDTLKRYDVAGPGWSNLTSDIMHGDRELLNDIRAITDRSNKANEAMDRIIASYFHNEREAENFRAMVQDGKLENFAYRIGQAQQEDAQDVVQTFVAEGSARVERQAQAAADTP